MNHRHFSHMPMTGSASTADCKALLEHIAPAEHPKGISGPWKRISKKGSGARIERVFVNDSVLCALVTQTQGLLAVELMEPSLLALHARMAVQTDSAPSNTPLGTVEARAPSAEQSPNESCEHLFHTDPAAGVHWLLDNGFVPNPSQDFSAALDGWAAPLLARMEALALCQAAGSGSDKSAPRSL